jgi:hypothetical protein
MIRRVRKVVYHRVRERYDCCFVDDQSSCARNIPTNVEMWNVNLMTRRQYLENIMVP